MKSLFLSAYLVLSLFVAAASCSTTSGLIAKDSINPRQFGLEKAKTATERYEVLLRCHKEALRIGKDVSYRGIGSISIEIPQNAETIPLSSHTDFAGVTIEVLNKSKNVFLFSIYNPLHPISISGRQIDNGSFNDIQQLKGKDGLLVIKDATPWVDKRRGYDYGATRKDVMKIHNGKGSVPVVQSYASFSSKPDCSFCVLDGYPVVFENLVFRRSQLSTMMTFLVKIENQADVTVSNVKIITPDSQDKFGDMAITAYNIANLKLKNIKIDGTYSQKNKYGYGINLDNVSNLLVENLQGRANWGIFGNNNINRVILNNCDINRFDIHCYGCDVLCKNTTFRGYYNQFSSFYGTLRYENCKFIHFVPVLFESSYSAYTYFKLEFDNCEIVVDKNRPYLISAGNPAQLADNPRIELSKACWPDILIKDLKVKLPEGARTWTIYESGGGSDASIYGMSEIRINKLEVTEPNGSPLVRLSNRKMHFNNNVRIRLFNSNIDRIE